VLRRVLFRSVFFFFFMLNLSSTCDGSKMVTILIESNVVVGDLMGLNRSSRDDMVEDIYYFFTYSNLRIMINFYNNRTKVSQCSTSIDWGVFEFKNDCIN